MMTRRKLVIILSVGVLLIPLIAMKFTAEVNWSMFDFIVAGILLISAGLLFDLAIRKIKKKTHRLVVVSLILIFFILLWAELAVGIFNSPIGGS